MANYTKKKKKNLKTDEKLHEEKLKETEGGEEGKRQMNNEEC